MGGCLSLSVDLLFVGEGRSEFLDGQAGEPLTHVNTGGEVLTLDKASKETTGEGITIHERRN